MKICDGFELVNIAEEYLVVPTGKRAESFIGVVVLNEASAFLFENMQKNLSVEELVSLLTEHYDLKKKKALEDISDMLDKFQKIGLISKES